MTPPPHHHPPPTSSTISMTQIHAPPTTHPITNQTHPNPTAESTHTLILPSTHNHHNTSSVIPTHTNSLPNTQHKCNITPVPMNVNISPTLRYHSPDTFTHIPPHDNPPIPTLIGSLTTRHNNMPMSMTHPGYPDSTTLDTNMMIIHTPHIIIIPILHMLPRTITTNPFTPRNPSHSRPHIIIPFYTSGHPSRQSSLMPQLPPRAHSLQYCYSDDASSSPSISDTSRHRHGNTT